MGLQVEFDAITAAIRATPGYRDGPSAHVDQIDLAAVDVRRKRLHRHARIQYLVTKLVPPCLADLVADYVVNFGFRLVDRVSDGIHRDISVGSPIRMFGTLISHNNPQHLELILLAMLVRRGIVAHICAHHHWYDCGDACLAVVQDPSLTGEYLRADATVKKLLAMPHTRQA